MPSISITESRRALIAELKARATYDPDEDAYIVDVTDQEVAAALSTSPENYRYHLANLQALGIVRFEGLTAGRRQVARRITMPASHWVWDALEVTA